MAPSTEAACVVIDRVGLVEVEEVRVGMDPDHHRRVRRQMTLDLPHERRMRGAQHHTPIGDLVVGRLSSGRGARLPSVVVRVVRHRGQGGDSLVDEQAERIEHVRPSARKFDLVVDVGGAEDVAVVGEWPVALDAFLVALHGVGYGPSNATALPALVAGRWIVGAEVHG